MKNKNTGNEKFNEPNLKRSREYNGLCQTEKRRLKIGVQGWLHLISTFKYQKKNIKVHGSSVQEFWDTTKTPNLRIYKIEERAK